MAAEVKVCNVCESIQASFQCFECDICMCDACKQRHGVFESQHQVHIYSLQTSKFCESHPTFMLQFYCVPCGLLICQLCKDEYHDDFFADDDVDHDVSRIEEHFTLFKKTFEDYQERVDAKLQKISEITDSFLSKEITSLNEVKERVPKLEANFKDSKEIALRRKKINSEGDQNLSKRLKSVIKHLDIGLPLDKAENIRELFHFAVQLDSEIKTHRMYFLPADIDTKMEDEIGTLDMTMGQLFSFHFIGPSFKSDVFFVGGIHWTISATAQPSSFFRKGTTLTLNSFIKEEDKLLVDSVTTDIVFTFILDDENSMVNNQSRTFSSNSNWRSDTLSCQLLYYDTNERAFTQRGNNLEILFDIKEIKYKNNGT